MTSKAKARKAAAAGHSQTARQEEPAAERDGAGFPIVGVGASAGGLEAFSALLRQLPSDTGLGFVLVQHLDPQHESALPQILARTTAMPVQEATQSQRVAPNHVYVIAPGTRLGIERGVLQLEPRTAHSGGARSIDAFFEALAEDQRELAIGVVLSGTASDGTLGLEAIKAEGGLTFAQDESAKYDSMPRSAVAAGCVDFVLSPAAIALELARIARHPYLTGSLLEPASAAEADRAAAVAHQDDDTPLPARGGDESDSAVELQAEDGSNPAPGGAEQGFRKVLLLLRSHAGVDFSLYKSSTIQRRVARRMVLGKHASLEEYASFLRGNARELDELYSDALIGVTSFFRNPEAFDVLTQRIFPELLKQGADEPLRVWVLGCSTGQEAYSIAMAFLEATDKASRARGLQIFATDLNEASLDKARHGVYAKSLAEDLSPERLRRFFTEEQGAYRINKALRDMVVFARQNLIGDPPFSRMDLVSCRNLLIYLEPSLQQKALPTFHYALKPGGFLFLGASESISGFTELFESADKKHKIFAKKAAPITSLPLPLRESSSPQGAAARRAPAPALGRSQDSGGEGIHAELNAQREADRVTVQRFAPPGVLINAELQILQFRGPTGAYLEPPSGKASFDVLKMAREGLLLPLRAAIQQAAKEQQSARRENVQLRQGASTRAVNVEVIPLKNLRERCFLILFEEAQGAAGGAAAATEPTADAPPPSADQRAQRRRLAELERELAETRDYLQSMQEQHEAAQEELQASNEEVQSANEELQSVNEELETSKEELESANEELTTVNEEMVNRNAELTRLYGDLINLQSSTQLAIVLLGRDLTVRRFSPLAEQQFRLLATDIDRPLASVRHGLVFASSASPAAPDLESFVAAVIADVRARECDVRDYESGRWFSLRVRPYFTLDNRVDGAVLVLVDIDQLKRSEQELVQKEASLREVHSALEAHATELTRFNEIAVGRELRMIELKREINQLCQRLSEAPRYSLEFERDDEPEAS